MVGKVDVELFPDALMELVEDGIGDVLEDDPIPVTCPECGERFEVCAIESACPKCGYPVRVQVG